MLPLAPSKPKKPAFRFKSLTLHTDRQMAVTIRTKRVTDPLNDEVKACLCGDLHRLTGYVSSGSGSEHEPDPISDLFDGFLIETDSGTQQPEPSEDSDSDNSDQDQTAMLQDLLNPTAHDRFRATLHAHVSKAVESVSSGFALNRSVFRRTVMTRLRDSGYNAGICKTSWESSGGLAAGNYEFIDVVRSYGDAALRQKRYFVDVDFAGEFEIARPTEEFRRILEFLPAIFVGRSDDLKKIVRLVSEEAKRSLKKREMYVPPWRKNRYMQTKWFGPYRRTVNQIPATASFSSENSIKFRSVGFDACTDAAAVNSRYACAAATRTRSKLLIIK